MINICTEYCMYYSVKFIKLAQVEDTTSELVTCRIKGT